MHYIIQSNLHQDAGMVRLKEVLEQFNLPYSEHKVIPFIGELEPEPNLDRNDVICFGSYSMRHYAKKMGWNPGVYDCEYYDHRKLNNVFGDLMLNSDATFCMFYHSNLYVTKENIEEYGGIFIRPIHDTKVFAGTVITDHEEFTKWWKSACELKEDDDTSLNSFTEVMVSIPKKIYTEYRFFVVDNQIITGSQYKIGGTVLYKEVDKSEACYRFAQEVLDAMPFKINLRSYVIDFAMVKRQDGDFDYRIIEINTMNSAGMYACDVQKIVMALEGKL